MDNKAMKNLELTEDQLEPVSGGTDNRGFCPKCGNPLGANNLCGVCNVLIPINPREIR